MLVGIGIAGQVGPPPEPPLTQVSASSTTDASPSSTDPEAASDAAEESNTPEPVAPDPLPSAEPTRVRIPSIDVNQSIFPIGLDESGALDVPRGDQADLAAWYDGSPTPGEEGPAVIEGHVTWGGDPSVFFELGGLDSGDQIEVDRQDGTTATFEVYDAARYPKDEFPTLDVYGRTDGSELRLITCGGDLGTDGHHLDNTIIYARLLEH